MGDLSRLNAIRYPDKVALRMGEARLTYKELDTRSSQLAHALVARNVKPGDRVALLAYNRLEYAVVTQAVAKCGAILVPMNFRLAPAEIRTILKDCEPKVLFAEPGFQPALAEAMNRAMAGTELEVVYLPDPDPAPVGTPTLESLCEGQPDRHPQVEVAQESPCVIMYTSGTTGAPKGVLVSHETYFRMYLATAVEASLRHDDVYLMAVPMFHAAGLNMMLHQALFMGASGVIHRGAFEPDAILKVIRDYRVTLAILVPTTVGILAFHPDLGSYDVSSLDKIFYGSMPITPRILDQAMKVFPQVAFTQFYGSTESGMLGVLRWADHDRWSQTTGRQALLSEMRIVDEEDKPVPVGSVGEVTGAKRTMGMIGYWRNEKATAETIRDGWIYTGDLARVEPEGFFTLVDRRKDLIISGGENIYPKEVENVLAAHPAVREVAVFGLTHELYGESVCAAVSLFPGQTTTAEDLVAFCRGKIAGYKIPRKVEILPALPRNASDKVQKGVLRARFSEM
jgi:acyl-CoA synthetase (AMP-forming)/AMP-acid ligase II